MSAFGDEDPRTYLYDFLRELKVAQTLTDAEVITAALDALALFSREGLEIAAAQKESADAPACEPCHSERLGG